MKVKEMTKKKMAKGITLNLLFAALVAATFMLDHEGPMRLLKVWTMWLALSMLIVVVALNSKRGKEIASGIPEPPQWYRLVNWNSDIIFLGVFAWQGAWFLFVFLLIHVILCLSVKGMLADFRNEQEPTEPG